MGPLQDPQTLYEAYKILKNRYLIKIYFIGDSSNYKPFFNIKDENVIFIPHLKHDKFLEFMFKNIDVGFLSLVNDYLGACVPSKLYEYINLTLPIVASLPYGDSFDIINYNSFGKAVHYSDISLLCDSIIKFTDKRYLNEIKNNIISQKDIWSMSNKINEVNLLLKRLIS